jgi:DNA-binding transcriptional LysR family regulator
MHEFVWDDLKYFALVGRGGSVAMAAKQTGVEHSTVARRITRLEEALNLRLFNRMARAWHLTEEGDALLAKVGLVEEQILSVRTFAASLETARGTVSVTAPPAFLSDVITPALSQFPAAYPNIDLRLIGETREANLSQGEADIAFRMSPIEGAELVTRTVCEVEYAFFGTPNWQQIPSNQRVFIGYSRQYQPALQATLERHAQDRRIVSQTNDLRVAFGLAQRGIGIALLPRFMVTEISGLTTIELGDQPIVNPVHLVMQKDVRKASRVRAVADYLCGHIPRHP